MFKVLLSLISILLLISCSSNEVAGGGDDFPNSIVAGMIVDSSGNGVPGVEVELIPYNYNPIDDLVNRIYKDTTNDSGAYNFEIDINSIYTIFAKHSKSGQRLLKFDLPVFLKNNEVGMDTLKPTGSIECVFPDSVAEDGYVYISGTPFYTDLKDGHMRIDGKYSVVIDSLPEVELPSVRVITDKKSVLGNLINVKATDTVAIGDTTTLPLWEFTILLGVSDETSDHYGSLDSVVTLAQKQIRQAMNKFNYPGVFDGVLNFVIDSVYEFTQDDTLEKVADWSWSNANIRILYDAFSSYNIGDWSSYYKTAVMVSDSEDSLFTSNRTDALVWFLGLARGCVGLGWLNVYGEYNPINGQDYLGSKSIMNMPYGETLWDDCSINIINYYAGEHYEGYIRDTRFISDTIIVSAINEFSGAPLEGAEINVYQVNMQSLAVESTSTVSGITDDNGQLILSLNPYDADADGTMAALNCLVTSVHNGDTSYCWMPYNDAVNSWMENSSNPYNVIVKH